eukprot:13493847-Alexandrium_andersonii.AAC.1
MTRSRPRPTPSAAKGAVGVRAPSGARSQCHALPRLQRPRGPQAELRGSSCDVRRNRTPPFSARAL